MLSEYSSLDDILLHTPLDGCVWSMKVILWDASCLDIQTTFTLQMPIIAKTFYQITIKMKAASPI